jgi:DNA-binding transcriptional ArsR family regulator
LVGSSKKILAAMRRALVDDNRSDAEVIRCLTAFTHPRRVALVLCLKRTRHPLSFSLLGDVCRMSAPALSRHLEKLRERGVIEETAKGWLLASKRSSLTNRLLAVICETERTPRG